MVAAPQLRSDKHVLSLDLSRLEGFLQALSNFLLVLIAECCIDVSVSDGYGITDSFLDFSGSRLPRACSC